jgi:hypothetical protein
MGRSPIYSPQELERISESLISGPKVHYENVAPLAGENIVIEKICPYMMGESIVLINIEKQTRRIEKYSVKARAHMGCFKECYEKKYYELLRITSPQ